MLRGCGCWCGAERKAMVFSSFEQPPTEDPAILTNMSDRRGQGRKGRFGTRLMRCRILLPRVRMRIISPGRLLDKMRESYLRLLVSHKKPDTAAITPFYQYQSVSYSSEAIAECIEFIKKSAAANNTRCYEPLMT
ncbi:hypothetical protein R1flu_009605 [Riccia fluitans]|uniref:Uncharacterized protein n=1 Tax=Riccia fluitans TaxID=41844 RepID=A0ABD1Z3E5_9MARC